MSGPDRDLAPGQIWRHHKSNSYYFIVAVALHTETQEQLVIYRRTDAHDIWARPLEMFLNEAEPGVKRFVRVR